jgi:hypothetical protein
MTGAVIVESTQPIVALVRIQKKVGARLIGVITTAWFTRRNPFCKYPKTL